MNRRAAAAASLVCLVLLAGCSVFGPGEIDQAQLDRTAEYDPYWEGETDVTVVVDKDSYRAIYRLEDQRTLELYRFHRFNNERALDPSAVRFRYPNGTVVRLTSDDFERTRDRTTVTVPTPTGTLAYTAPKSGKRLRVATVLEDASYELILPPNARVQYPLLGRVVPREYRADRVDGQVRLRWDDPGGDRIVVRYYLVRDLWLFGGLFSVAAAAAIGGTVYFLLQLRRVKARREEVALPDDP